MDELGNDTNEFASNDEVGQCSDYAEVDFSNVDDSELEEGFYGIDTVGDFRTDETYSDANEDFEWTEEDYKDNYFVPDTSDSEFDAEVDAVDINECVPDEWNQIEGEHDYETDAERVNPNYDPESNGVWENNCQSCAPAYEMRRRGYDVEAKPFSEENEYLSIRPEDAWDNPDINTTEGNGKADIEHQMQEWGDGSRAEVVIYWKQGGGHAISAEQVDGETRFIDPQVASSDEISHDAGDYFVHVRDDGSTYFWRTDNAKVNQNIEDCCKEVEQ